MHDYGYLDSCRLYWMNKIRYRQVEWRLWEYGCLISIIFGVFEVSTAIKDRNCDPDDVVQAYNMVLSWIKAVVVVMCMV